jgi:hypothetical protein
MSALIARSAPNARNVRGAEAAAPTATFLLNFTDLDTGGGTGTNVMPGLTFGVRF